MKKLIIILFILPSLSQAQDTRQIKVKPITPIDTYLSLIEHIDDLEKLTYSKSTVRNFSKLFSNDALINDIVPSQNFGKQLSVLDYTNISKKLKRKRLSSLITITELNTGVTPLTTFSVGR